MTYAPAPAGSSYTGTSIPCPEEEQTCNHVEGGGPGETALSVRGRGWAACARMRMGVGVRPPPISPGTACPTQFHCPARPLA